MFHHHHRPRIGAMLALAGVVPLVAALLGPPAATAQPSGPVTAAFPDLAALVLSPLDAAAIDRPGYGHDAAATRTLSDQVADLARACGVAGDGASPTGQGIAARLQEAGWRRQYVNRNGLSDPADPTRFARVVTSSVTEYADAAGAAAGFVYLEDEAGTCFGVGEDLPRATPVGEVSELTRLIGAEPNVQTLALTFRTGPLVVSVCLTDAVGDPPEEAVVEALGHRLLERIEAARLGKARPLADAVLRLDAPGVPADAKLYGAVPGTRLAGVMEDAYLRRDGHDVPEAGETAAAFAARQAAFATAIDVYQVRQRLGAGTVADPVYRSLLARFESAEVAATWFPGIQAFAQIQGVTGVVPVPVVEAPRFGDESLTLAFQFREGETASAGYLISARVGADVVIVLLRAAEAPPLATVAGLMTAQLVCLEARACQARHPVPPEVA